jgi:uncharacterized protein (DUF58 family)
VIDLDFLHHLDRFSLLIRKRITSNYSGEHRSSMVGAGLIFRDHSPYAPGADFRSIDWKVYARTDRLYVKRYETERNLKVHIIVDFSASMRFGSHNVSKSDWASMIGIGYAYMAFKNNERFVLSTFAEQLEPFKPKKGRRQLASMINYLNDKKPIGKTDIEAAMGRYKKLINSRSLIVIVSDFLYEIEQIKQVLSRINKHQVLIVQVLDPQELDLQGLDGDYKLKDSETPAQMRTHISPLLRKQYMKQLSEHNDELKKAVLDSGAQYYLFQTDKPVFDAFWEMMSDGVKTA